MLRLAGMIRTARTSIIDVINIGLENCVLEAQHFAYTNIAQQRPFSARMCFPSAQRVHKATAKDKSTPTGSEQIAPSLNHNNLSSHSQPTHNFRLP